jgi:hypothetical protein
MRGSPTSAEQAILPVDRSSIERTQLPESAYVFLVSFLTYCRDFSFLPQLAEQENGDESSQLIEIFSRQTPSFLNDK